MSSSRKHLNPATEAAPGLHPTRRAGGARRELSERVVFRGDGREIDGWALNASRSGLRAIVEEAVPLGAEFDVSIGEAAARPGRVVWLQEEKDGAIVGVAFLDEAARGGSIPDFSAPVGAGTPMPPSTRPAPPAPPAAAAAEASDPTDPARPEGAGESAAGKGSDRPGP